MLHLHSKFKPELKQVGGYRLDILISRKLRCWSVILVYSVVLFSFAQSFQGPFGILSGLSRDLLDEIVPVQHQANLPHWIRSLFDHLDDSPDFHVRGPRFHNCSGRQKFMKNILFSFREAHEMLMTPELKHACLEIAHRRPNLYGSGNKRRFWTELKEITAHDGIMRPEFECIQEVILDHFLCLFYSAMSKCFFFSHTPAIGSSFSCIE